MAAFNSSCDPIANEITAFGVLGMDIGLPGGLFFDPEWLENQTSASSRGPLHRGMQNINKAPHVGVCVKDHGDLFWFGHVHIIPKSFILGNVLTTQEREYEVYNAYRETTKTITQILQSNVEGLVFVGDPQNSPRTLAPLTGFVVDVDIEPTGPTTITASVAYTWDAGEVLTVTFTGSRAIIMTTEPEAFVAEKWEWVTDLIQSGSGEEQRISVRDVPRQTLTYRFVKEDQDAQFLVNQLWGWHENTWALPVWTDYTTLTSDISAGVLSLPIADEAQRDFRAGTDELALIWSDSETFEAVEVSSINAGTLTLIRGTLQAWSAGAFVMPLRLAKMPKGWQARNHNVAAREISVDWLVTGNVDFENTSSPQVIFDGGIYQGLPVWDILTDYLITGGSYSENEMKDLNIFPDRLGKFHSNTARDFPKNTLTGFSMQAYGRAEFWRLRQFLHYFRGRQKTVWVSTGKHDFVIESTQTASSVDINVEIVNYTNLVWNAPDGPKTRKDIEIVYADGVVDRRRITVAQLTAGLRETLTLNAGISQDASIANVERVSFLVKRRLTSDKLTFNHEWFEGEVTVPGIGLVDVHDGG